MFLLTTLAAAVKVSARCGLPRGTPPPALPRVRARSVRTTAAFGKTVRYIKGYMVPTVPTTCCGFACGFACLIAPLSHIATQHILWLVSALQSRHRLSNHSPPRSHSKQQLASAAQSRHRQSESQPHAPSKKQTSQARQRQPSWTRAIEEEAMKGATLFVEHRRASPDPASWTRDREGGASPRGDRDLNVQRPWRRRCCSTAQK